MLVFRFWAKIFQEVKLENFNNPINIVSYGGSNCSHEDALNQAKIELNRIKYRIANRFKNVEPYVTPIREEIINSINNQNIITRNRYGALILNSENHAIIDIDQPRKHFLDIFLKSAKTITCKELMLKQIEATANQSEFLKLGFRIYETRRGYRIIVTGQNIRSTDSIVPRLFKKFNCDSLYAKLCLKQDCFRARLTPKPSNLKLQPFKVIFPRNYDENRIFSDWLISYKNKSEVYATCKFVKSIRGSDLSPIIQLHDNISQAYSDKELA